MLESISLRNWCQHEKLDIEFRNGLNGVLGKNGNGKSNLLDAIRFGDTGESINHGNLADNITWGKDTASVENVYLIAGTRYTIRRTITRAGKSTARLKIEGGETLTKAGEISDFLDKLWDTNTEARLNNIYIPQGKLDSILFARPAERYKEFQKTFGLENLEKAHTWLKTEANAYQITPDLDQILREAVTLWSESETEQTRLMTVLGLIEIEIKTLAPCENIIKLAMEATRTQQAIKAAEAQVAAASTLLGSKTAFAHRAGELANASAGTLEIIRPKAEETTKLAQALQSAIDAYAKTQLARERVGPMRQRLQALGTVPAAEQVNLLRQKSTADYTEWTRLGAMLTHPETRPKLPQEVELEKQSQALQWEAATAQAPEPEPAAITGWRYELKELEKHLQLAKDGKCPTCGSTFQHSPAAIEEQIKAIQLRIDTAIAAAAAQRQARIADVMERGRANYAQLTQMREMAITSITEARNAAEQVLNAGIAARETAEKAFAEHQKLTNELQIAEASLAHAPATKPDDSKLAEMQEFLRAFAQAEKDTRDHDVARQLALSEANAAKRALDQAEANLKALGEAGQAPSPEAVRQAQLDAEELSARRASMNTVLQEIGINKALLAQREGEVNRLREKMTREGNMAKWVDQVKLVRDVLHVTSLPTLVMREFARVLNARMEEYLHLWEAPFRMWLDDDLGFQVEFDDGKKLDAARLSGGQKITASASFRLAMSDTFAASVGLLILDEPSVYLDKDNIQHLQVLLMKLKEMSTHSGRQILVVTHEESLMGFMDHVISL